MNKLFSRSVTTQNDTYAVTFNVNEKNEVLATVRDHAEQLLYKDVELVDLSGRKTRVPATVHNAIASSQPTPAQNWVSETFQRVCVARLNRSIGCFARL